ncbi:unnamed protein product, partial [Meganyctiphanes norvegica]
TIVNMQEDRQLLCKATNDIARQKESCFITIYLQGLPESVSNCSVDNYTATSFSVHCAPGPLRGQRTLYHLAVHAQIQGSETKIASEGEEEGPQNNTIGPLISNITASAPSFHVNGLQHGKFKLIIRGSNEEGLGPPYVVDAFLQQDNAQTVIGLPSSGGGQIGSSGGNGGGSPNLQHPQAPGLEPESQSQTSSKWLPVLIVLICSVTGLLSVASVVILVVHRCGVRRRRHREIEQLKMSEEVAFEQIHSSDAGAKEKTDKMDRSSTTQLIDAETTAGDHVSVRASSGRSSIDGSLDRIAVESSDGRCTLDKSGTASPAVAIAE